MFKRTKGYLLLTMLVLTGLAGRMHMDTLSGKERRTVIRELKTARSLYTQQTASLTEKQLNFRPEGWEQTIGACIMQHAVLQQKIWDLNRRAIKKEAADHTLDNAALARLENDPGKVALYLTGKASGYFYSASADNYLQINADMLRFLRTTTDNVRAQQVEVLKEKLDAYQLLQLSVSCTLFYCRLIDDARKDSRFPL